jgi:hypothetical protein
MKENGIESRPIGRTDGSNPEAYHFQHRKRALRGLKLKKADTGVANQKTGPWGKESCKHSYNLAITQHISNLQNHVLTPVCLATSGAMRRDCPVSKAQDGESQAPQFGRAVARATGQRIGFPRINLKASESDKDYSDSDFLAEVGATRQISRESKSGAASTSGPSSASPSGERQGNNRGTNKRRRND